MTAVIAAALFVVADGRLLAKAGLFGRCQAVAAPAAEEEGTVQACRAGKLEGRPDLRRDSCRPIGSRGQIQYWHCPAAVSSGRGGPNS